MPENVYTFQYTCRLCQQSPLMHYQHREPGATLRVPQVRSAFHRFLRGQYGDAPYPAGWLTSHGTLDFSLRLVAAEPPRVEEVGEGTPYDLFYSNPYTPNTRKAVVGDCLLTVTCFEPTLMAFIKENLTPFFAVTNFGALKSKGFGSYLPEGAALSPAEVSRLLCRQYGAPTCYGFETPDRDNLYRQINTLYRVIKGGIHTPPRRRGLLALYTDRVCGFDSERTMVKESGVVSLPYRRLHPQGRYLRGLLGQPEGYRFGIHREAPAVSVRYQGRAADRPSPETPLFIKIIGERVYLVARPLPPTVYGAPFRFQNKATGAAVTLTTPTREELGEDFIHRFLAYCAGELSGPHNRLRGLPYMEGIELKEVAP